MSHLVAPKGTCVAWKQANLISTVERSLVLHPSLPFFSLWWPDCFWRRPKNRSKRTTARQWPFQSVREKDGARARNAAENTAELRILNLSVLLGTDDISRVVCAGHEGDKAWQILLTSSCRLHPTPPWIDRTPWSRAPNNFYAKSLPCHFVNALRDKGTVMYNKAIVLLSQETISRKIV